SVNGSRRNHRGFVEHAQWRGEIRGRADRQVDARRRLLGRGNGRVRLLRSRPCAACAVQSHIVGGSQGEQAVSSRSRSGVKPPTSSVVALRHMSRGRQTAPPFFKNFTTV